MSVFEWAFVGAIFLGIMLFCARIMRRGLTTLDEDRKKYLERIQAGERQLAEDRKKIPAREHMLVMRAAVEDLVRLDGSPPGFSVTMGERYIELQTPEGIWRIELAMRERSLRSARRVLHGRSRWVLSGFGHVERHSEQKTLMASLNAHLHGKIEDEEDKVRFPPRPSFYNDGR